MLLRIVFICNIVCIFLLLTSNLAPYLDPAKWWPVALAGLFFPLLAVITLLFLFFWLLVRSRKAILPLAALLLSLPNIITTYGFSFPSKSGSIRGKDNLRILSWNTGLMNYSAPDSNTAIRNNEVIFTKLKEANADILCLQEFFTAVIPHHLNFIDSICKMLNYPYYYFSYDRPKFEGKFYSGSIIFSRYPIADTGKLVYPGPFIGSIIKAGIIFSGDTVDIFTTRLQSVNFQRQDYMEISGMKNGSDNSLSGAKSIIYKLRLGYRRRIEQVKLVKEMIGRSRRPLVFTGDLNDVPVSYTYKQIKTGLKDAWVKKGCGLGRTFIYLSPTLRIDHVFYNGRLKARQVKRILSDRSSDHHGLLADLALKEK